MRSPHSMLYVPAADEHKVANIPRIAAAVILDLEDSVAPSMKTAARLLAGQVITGSAAASDIWVRVNSLDSEFAFEDIKEVVRPGLSGIVLPKVDSPNDVKLADHLIKEYERRSSMALGKIRLIATIESAVAVDRLRSISRAAARLVRLCFGALDFSLDVGLNEYAGRPAPAAGLLDYVRCRLVIESRAAGLSGPHDSAYLRVNDVSGLRCEAEIAKAMGFSGKHAIHPAQLPVIEEVFSARDWELAHAGRIVRDFSAGQAAGAGVVVVDGEVIDYPAFARAKRFLADSGKESKEEAAGGK
jgi:citrate lyase beta subunit